MLFKNSSLVFQISKFLLIVLFTYAASVKLFDLEQFAGQLRQIALLKNFAGFISVALPLVEFITALCLVFNRTLMIGLASAAFLMTEFTIYVGAMLVFSSNLPCSCGGVIEQMTWKEHFVFNLFFMVLSWNALVNYYKYSTQLISTNTKEVS
jgi:hypothetical protein